MTIFHRQVSWSYAEQATNWFYAPSFATLLLVIPLLFLGANVDANAAQIESSVVANKQQSANSQIQPSVERIVVTANRSKTTMLSTQASVSAIDSRALDLIGHQHISQALSRISGTWISRGNGQEHLTAVRSPVLTGAGGCGAFFMALDGISLRAPGFCNANQLFDANSEQAKSD